MESNQMNLGKSINNLLKRYEEVRVAGIGLFIRKQNPASFDKERQVFLPPITYIEFDARAAGGYDLTQYIQQQLQLDNQAAKDLIHAAVVDVKEQLAQKGQAKLENLGFLISYGDSFVFKPLDLSGFNYTEIPAPVEIPEPVEIPVAVEIPVVAESPVIPNENITGNAENVPEDIISLDPKPEPIPAITNDTQVYTPTPKKSSGTIWYIITAIIVLGAIAAAFLLNPNLKDQLLGTKKVVEPLKEQPVIAPPVLDTLPKQEVVDSLEVKTDSTALIQADSIAAAAKVLAPVVAEKKANWQIVIGTHATMEQAMEQVKRLQAKGHKQVQALETKFKSSRRKVIWNTYADKASAELDLISVQKNIEKSAWLDKIK